jgi:hypothetical protein
MKMKAITKPQAHMLTMARLLGWINHNSGFKGGIRTARALAGRGLLTLKEGDAGTWTAYIPAATLMNEAGVQWASEGRSFVRMGDTWNAKDQVIPGAIQRFYAARTWHDGRTYFLVIHPITENEMVVFADDLHIKEYDGK